MSNRHNPISAHVLYDLPAGLRKLSVTIDTTLCANLKKETDYEKNMVIDQYGNRGIFSF